MAKVPQGGRLSFLAAEWQLVGAKANALAIGRVKKRAEEGSEITPAGDGRKVVELGKHTPSRERNEHAE